MLQIGIPGFQVALLVHTSCLMGKINVFKLMIDFRESCNHLYEQENWDNPGHLILAIALGLCYIKVLMWEALPFLIFKFQ